MPRKKDPPPSVLPPRRSTRGVAKSTSISDGEDSATLVMPCVGLSDSQTGFERAPQPPSLDSTTNVCDINKEVSLIPSVLVSLDESEQDMGLNQSDASFHATRISLPGKTGLVGCACFAGMSDSDSSGSPGVKYLSTGRVNHSGSVTEVGGVGYAAVSSNPPVRPLFSPVFKAMMGRNYLKTQSVFSPRAPLSGDVKVGTCLWSSMAPSQTVSDVSNVPDMGEHDKGGEFVSDVHVFHDGVHEQVAKGGGLSQGVGEITIPPDAVQDGLDMPMQVNDKVQVEYVEEVQLGQEPNVGSEGGDMHMHEHEMLHVLSVEEVHVGLDSSEGVDMHAHEKGLHNVGINGGKKEGRT
ncbi:hypothetical protein L1987_02010 [Smallanthus sonchifolius]|uniref:Uncharacterized protein n=1 Tax=Smallanthus sonchifolius TaxID=185202 RepID=A0ACB9K6T4_9ASTR|nr:hypothetical protein L1987_02010 [Smallanthus sonchifolius]